ncbi:hypothetical protein GCM10010172_39740 [Paractinoplanes ferrugineus]|uniref:Acyl transferase domain-containing protein n=1 Tax=Paractinoplanes ferrugineus TaxID=113564 RepID=A0A919MAM9_9ACTN|nr:type I polyketide synthase [Actinoplanes ferrugineus]GIE12751.1 hypothetical protein Afe05nite_45910 [Actinoplanes ferrugineus]
MTQGVHRVVLVVGIGHRPATGPIPPAAAVWSAIEDAGAIASAAQPIVVLTTVAVPDLDGIEGVLVHSADDPFAAAEACLLEETAALVVVPQGPDHPAVALALGSSADDGYGPLPADRSTISRLSAKASAPGAELPFTAPLLVSGRTEAGFRAYAKELATYLERTPQASIADTAYTLAMTRTIWPQRAVIAASERAAVVAALERLATGVPGEGLVRGATDPGPGPVFVYPGQGAQWAGMATELAATAPVFADALAECARELRPYVDFELADALSGAVPMDRVEVIQPALFAVMVALTRLWQSNGITPAAVVGHSFGEIAAVTAAGGLSLADGCRLVAAVSQALARLQGNGDMVAVALPADRLGALIAEWGLDLEIAVVNGPSSTVVAGPGEAAAELVARLRERGDRARILPINIAGHTRHMEPIHEYLIGEVAPIRPRASTVPVHSSTAPEPLDTAVLDAEHWFASLRDTAEFQRVTETLLGSGHRLFIEMSPHPVLAMSITETAARAGREAVVLDTMRRDDAGYDRYVRALAESHLNGAAPDWSTVLSGARKIPLPAYRPDRDTTGDDGDSLRDRLLPLNPDARLEEVVRLVSGLLPAGEGADQDFRSLGVDSVGALALRNRLNELTGLRLSVTLLFDHPTPRAVAAEVVRAFFGGTEQEDTGGPTDGPPDPREPIAIVGMACRFPGRVDSPADLWRMVHDGRDGITAFPGDRGWDLGALYDPDAATAGTFYPREAGMLEDVAGFDADFFGISPREALAMDPQQRLLLETTWAALEDGGIDGTALRGSRTGVFTGIMNLPYGSPPHQAQPELEGYVVTGTLASVASGRVAYVLGLEGPALTLDTACSSSLVALHLAAQSLQRGESDLALVGGATVMAEPGLFIEFSRLRGLAADGRSKPFSAAADGFGMAEGVAVLVAERLSDAQRLGHPVLALVRGSAINQDGASNGMTAPSGPAQQRVIRAALRDAGLGPVDVDVIEAHGTGTKVGDPIEAQALIATYGRGRPADRPIRLGSVKSNIGHTQSASGIAGVIKMVEAMRHGVMPRSLHAENPTPEVDWSAGTIELLAENREWPNDEHPRRAGVSSFGISGTNAHVILEEFVAGPPAAELGGVTPLILSGKSPEAVRDHALALHRHLTAHPDLPLGDVAGTLAHRAVFAHRAVVSGDREQIRTALTTVTPVPVATRVAAVFSGQGAQHLGMGRQLAADFPVFAAALDEACAHLDPLLGRPLREVMWSGGPALIDRTEYTQPALFAFQVALARLWQSWGLTFAALAGHSVGEIAVAHIAGVLTLPDAARLAVTRGRLMGALPAGGAMAAVDAPAAEVEVGGGMAIAAINGPRSVVVSGPEAEVGAAVAGWKDRGHRATVLRVSHAFHSPLMEPMLAAFAAELDTLTFHRPTIAISSSADTGHPITTAAYWTDHARNAVLFHRAVTNLPEVDVLLEIGPGATLTPLVDNGIPSTRRNQDETPAILTAAAGLPVDWRRIVPAGGPTPLPGYPFQHQRYWLGGPDVSGAAYGSDPQTHPMLTQRTDLPGTGGVLLSGKLTPGTDPWLSHHVVMDTILLPGTGFVELAVEAGRAVGAGTVEELVLRAPMVFPAGRARELQVWIAPDQGDGQDLQIRTREPAGEWTLHATGLLGTRRADTSALGADWAGPVWPPAGATEVPGASFYPDLAARGYEYGPAFHGVKALWIRGDDLFADVVLPEGQPTGFGIHPALLDAALHALPITGRLYDGADDVRLPFSFNGVSLLSADARRVRMRIRVDDATGSAAAYATDPDGRPVLAMESLIIRSVQRSQLESAGAIEPAGRFAVGWERLATAAGADRVPGNWLVLGAVDPQLTALLSPVPAGAVPDGVLVGAGGAEDLLAALHEVGDVAPVWCVTSGAVGVGTGDPAADVRAAGAWGLGRVAALELPGRWGGLIDLPAGVDAAGARLLAGILSGAGDEDQLAIRDGAVWARRLVAAPPAGTETWTPKGTVLITGGTGGLGGQVARRLAALGTTGRLVLLSRRGADAPGAAQLTEELVAAGANPLLVAADITDRRSVGELIDRLAAEGTPVSTVVHTAGVVSETRIADLGPEALAAETAAKVQGALVLDELLADLDDFVLFSSISGTWGAAGQAAYAAGNAQLDALARRRHASGRPATAIAWGPWLGGGMLTDRDERELRRRGLAPLAVPSAILALEQVVAARAVESVVVNVAWPRFLPAFTASRPSRLLVGFEPAATPEPVAATGAGSLTERLAALPVAERRPALLEVVCANVAALIGQSEVGRIDPGRALKDLGFDSLTSVELRNKFAALLGIRLSATLVFDFPTPHALADHLLTELDLGAATGADVPLLEEYGRIEAKALSPLTATADRLELTARLRGLLDQLELLDERPDRPADTGTAGLEHASVAELMNFIDAEFGNP